MTAPNLVLALGNVRMPAAFVLASQYVCTSCVWTINGDRDQKTQLKSRDNFGRQQSRTNSTLRDQKSLNCEVALRDERVKILVNFCIRKVNRIPVRRSRKSGAARPREWWKHAVRKFRRAVSMKITVKRR